MFTGSLVTPVAAMPRVFEMTTTIMPARYGGTGIPPVA
jgi:hypothetical protein